MKTKIRFRIGKSYALPVIVAIYFLSNYESNTNLRMNEFPTSNFNSILHISQIQSMRRNRKPCFTPALSFNDVAELLFIYFIFTDFQHGTDNSTDHVAKKA